ncbi:LysR family transcriptional regulator [Morganella morganii]|uniref:LysR family transcriptional regulator n=1 Tax=Morganella morganii TaxID=582 RepID=UPI0021D2F9BF|nr:LysR family transcriptional regulator [Morganella morganii]MCU6377469.1 LysR family transcriptional regulator [Morganella morganii]
MNNIKRLDLNQLVTLHALLRERHVSRAAVSLHRSQPAVSHTLNQLRDLFQDPLLIRRQGRYHLSGKAEALYAPLTQALSQLDDLIAQQDFRPENCTRRFNIAMSDYGAAIFSGKLIRYLRTAAPQVDLQIWQGSREEMQGKLQEGSLDLAFGVFTATDYTLRTKTVFTDTMVSVADKQYCTNGTMPMADWLSHPHILASMKPYEANEIDRQLQLLNYRRRIAVSVPYWQIASQLPEGTDLILTVAQRALPETLSPSLQVFTPPLTIAPLSFQMLWHQRSEGDAALGWLREAVMQVCD